MEEKVQEKVDEYVEQRNIMKEGDLLKSQGNDFVRNTQYTEAIESYKAALTKMDPSHFQSVKDRALVTAYVDASNKIMNNLSLCYLKIKDYKLCEHFSQ